MENKRHRNKNIAIVGLTASLALLLSYVEALLPPIFAAVPGIKVGLPNVLIIYLLYCMGVKYAAPVSVIRVAVSSLLFGTPLSFIYSIAGATLSITVMTLVKRSEKFSAVGVSVFGGVTHNLGQILVAVFLLNTPRLVYYMTVLTVTGTLSGVFIGLLGALLIKRVPAEKFLRSR